MNAKVIHKFIVGSSAFFKNIQGFKPKDLDVLFILDCPIFGYNVSRIRKDNNDKFMLYNSGKDKLIETINDPLQVGKFLVPDFVNYIKLEIDDLEKLNHWFDKLDEKHKYEKIIYDAYIQNNAFYLTDDQLLKAYNIYMKYR